MTDSTTPPPIKAKNCPNCNAPMDAADNWCRACGQKAYDGPPSFWHLISHFFETVFSLDNRLFRTLAALVIPGRLTNHFLAGKQKPYFHPLRLFFVSGVLLVATASFYAISEAGDDIDSSLEQRRARAYRHQFGEDLRKGVDQVKLYFPNDDVAVASDSLFSILGVSPDPKSDSVTWSHLEYQGGLSFRSKPVKILRDDAQILSPNEIVEKYGADSFLSRYAFKQTTRLNRLNSTAVAALIGQSIWGLLLMMPLTAGMLKLFYIRRKRRFVEHFIFALHTHAFMFFLLSAALLFLVLSGSFTPLIISSVIVTVYVLFALKRMYQQKWWKTIVKAAMMSWGYLFLLTLALSVATVIAVMLF